MGQSNLRRSGRLALALTALWLAGCATPENLPAGTEQSAVLARLGAPAERHKLPAGERWVYPLGGLNQETWMVDLDPAGRVAGVHQVLDMRYFSRVKVDVDTMADVRREFGPPRLVRDFQRVQRTAWLYAYRENGFWNSEMAIYFDPQGIVRKVENGPDPRFLGGGDRRD